MPRSSPCRSILVLVIPAWLAWSGDAWARDGEAEAPVKFGRKQTGFGLGISVGDPMGASLKYFLHPRHALQGHIAWGLAHHGDGLVTLEYVWHTPTVGDSPIVDASFYFGGGVGLAFWAQPGPRRLQTHEQNSTRGAAMMLRVPVLGLAFHWTEVPLDTALEVAWSPYVIMPDLVHFDASLKVRYFF